MQTSQIRLDTTDTHVVDDLLSYISKHDGVYYVQLEKGDESGKMHWQGWCEYPTDKMKEDTFRKTMARKCTKHGLSGKDKQFCFGAVTSTQNWQSYILKNNSKEYVDMFLTNIEDIDALRECLPEYQEKGKKAANKVLSKNWFDRVIAENLDKLVCANMSGQHLINYKMIQPVVLSTLPKSLDFSIYRRLLVGVGNYLEQKYPHPTNLKFRSYLSDKIRDNDPSLYDILH